jgi:hypothetical protein
LLQVNKNSTSAASGGLRIATADSNESLLELGVSTSLDKAFISSLANGSGSVRPLTFVCGASSSNERMRIDSSGKINIGTTSATQKVSVGTSATETIGYSVDWTGAGAGQVASFTANTSTGEVRIGATNSAGTYFPTFYSNNSERMRIDSSGRLLYGHSTSRNVYGIVPGVQIEGTQFESSSLSITCNNVSDTPILLLARSRGSSLGSNTALTDGQTIGEISFVPSDGTDTRHAAVRIQGIADDNLGSNDVPGRFVVQTVADGSESSVERFRISNDGRLYVPGVWNFSTSGGTTVVVTSDNQIRKAASSLKYKTDIETLEDSYADRILDVRPVYYRSTCEGDNPSHSYWGFIAEEVAEIDPRLVSWKTTETTYDENGSAVQTACDPEPEGVQYERFVTHLLNLIKRQKARIEALETQQADLLARVTALEAA